MILYIIVFFLFFLSDNFKNKNKFVYNVLVTCVAIFFCFGYMCGSDWMDYEYAYDHNEWVGNDLEFGLNVVFRFFHLFNTDFWIVNALCKLFFFYVVFNFYSVFSNRPMTIAGLSITTMCFMLISCPMRFMMATAFILIATKYYMKRNWLSTVFYLIIATLFHLSILVVAIIAATAISFSQSFAKIKTRWLILSYFGMYFLLITTQFNDLLFQNFLLFLLDKEELEAYALSYGDRFSISSFFSIGRLREIVSFMAIIYLRKYLLCNRYGYLVFYFAILSLFISPIIMGMATMFRLNIFFYSFVDIALVVIIFESIIKNKQYTKLLKYTFVSMVFFSFVRTITSDYTFIPYSNSIPYIITGHLPLSERLDYNKKAYKERTGHSYDKQKNN